MGNRVATRRKTAPALLKAMTPSPTLAAIIGPEARPRGEITAALWAYIKSNGLQDLVNNRMIHADEKLRPLFDGQDQVSMFEMTKLVAQHLGYDGQKRPAVRAEAATAVRAPVHSQTVKSDDEPMDLPTMPAMASAAALTAEFAVSPFLAAVVGAEPKPRGLIARDLWAYIKTRGLQDRVNKRMINADEALRPVFDGRSQVSMFEVTKYVNQHIRHIPSSAPEALRTQRVRVKPARGSEPEQAPFSLTLDRARVEELKSDTEIVGALLGAIFEATDGDSVVGDGGTENVVPSHAMALGGLRLDRAHGALAKVLLARDQWTRSEAASVADALGLMLDGALETMNEASIEAFELPLFDGDDPIEVAADVRALVQEAPCDGARAP